MGYVQLASKLDLFGSYAAVSLRPCRNVALHRNRLVLLEISPVDIRSAPMEARRGANVNCVGPRPGTKLEGVIVDDGGDGPSKGHQLACVGARRRLAGRRWSRGGSRL